MCQVCNPTRVWHPSALMGLLVVLVYLGVAYLGWLAIRGGTG